MRFCCWNGEWEGGWTFRIREGRESNQQLSLSAASAIRLSRMRSGRSASSVAKAAGLSPSYVSKIERGECEPSLKAFSKIAQVLELHPFLVALVVLAEAGRGGEVTAG